MILLMPNLLYYGKVCFPIYSTICGCVCVCLVLVYCDHIVYARLGCKKSIHLIHCCTLKCEVTYIIFVAYTYIFFPDFSLEHFII